MRHNTPIPRFVLLALFNLILLGLAACGTQATKPETKTAEPELDLQARTFYQSGDFSAAAEEYLSLVITDPVNRIKYQLGAADALIKHQEVDRAQQIIDVLSQEKLNDVQLVLKNIYAAQIFLAKDDPGSAYTRLNIELPSATPRAVFANFYRTRAMTLHLKQEYFAAAKERILLNAYLDDTQEISENYLSLWQSLSQLGLNELETIRADNAEILGSWLELAIINKTMLQNTANLEAAIATWQQRYPDHPALVDIVTNIIESSRNLAKLPTQIALLLPFTEKYNDASVAIRDGFMAAWYESDYTSGNDSSAVKPGIRIYNTDVDNVVDKYAQAIAEGADFVVGPLQKPAVANLLENGNITTTTLVLNEYEGQHRIQRAATSGLPVIIQFGLAPEEEARQVAERAWFDGRARAISITTNDERGQRINNAFASHWKALGGTMLDHVSIGQNVEELGISVKHVLNIGQSEERAKNLRNKLQRSLKTEARRRQDVDLIFMSVSPAIARQLVPQLRYYRMENIALYSISNIYTGNENTRADSDIDGVAFVDMPWVIDPENEYSPLNRMIERYRKPVHATYKRLYAFGIDAYDLIPHLAGLMLQPAEQYQGKTGYLKLDNQGRVHRRLIWARFTDGKPQLSDTTELN